MNIWKDKNKTEINKNSSSNIVSYFADEQQKKDNAVKTGLLIFTSLVISSVITTLMVRGIF